MNNLFSPAQFIFSQGAARDARSAKNEAANLRARVQMLENNLAKALLINEALWELVRDKLSVTVTDFHDKLYEIDMRDGQLDGKNQRSTAKECPKCRRMVSPRHTACLYCGHIMDDSVFSIS